MIHIAQLSYDLEFQRLVILFARIHEPLPSISTPSVSGSIFVDLNTCVEAYFLCHLVLSNFG